MKFKKAIILGVDQLAYQCAKILKLLNLPTEVYDTNTEKSLYLERKTQREHIPYSHLNRTRLFDILINLNISTLIISAVNPYIIPEDVLDNKKITAINCHHALLPKHPGRNAEAWAIYEEDVEAGITWHFITPDVDAGNIIIQKKITLDDSFTSLKLLRNQNILAYQSFKEIINDVLADNIAGYSQDLKLRGSLHYSWEIPNDGIINLEWNGKKISAFLRSMDYGILNNLGKTKLLFRGDCFSWKKYSIVRNYEIINEEEIYFSDTSISINKGDYMIILDDYHKVE